MQGAAGAEARVRDMSSTCAPGVWLQEGVVWGNRPGKAERPVPAPFPNQCSRPLSGGAEYCPPRYSEPCWGPS